MKMDTRTTPDDLAREIQTIMKNYGSAVDTALTNTLKELAKETASDLKATSPMGRTKRYARGWGVKEVSKGSYVVYNRRYQLTHLLEKGHKTRFKTGRYGMKTFVPAQPHIAPAEEKMKSKVDKDFEKQLSIQSKKI